jgi:hypothetical protein
MNDTTVRAIISALAKALARDAALRLMYKDDSVMLGRLEAGMILLEKAHEVFFSMTTGKASDGTW